MVVKYPEIYPDNHKYIHKYKEINDHIRNKIRDAKEINFEVKFKEIEDLQMRYDLFNLHKNVKKLPGTQRRRPTSVLLDSNGNTIMQTHEELFEDKKVNLGHIGITCKEMDCKSQRQK